MNYIWTGIIIISFISAAIGGNLQETLSAGLDGAKSAFDVLISFAGIICFWSGFLKVAEKSGCAGFCEKLLSPVIRRLFPKVKNRSDITMNIIANLLGMGNAATPAGISAMSRLDEGNRKSPYPSHEMCRFAVLNTASLQILPTTVIGILASCGCKNPFGIVPCVWLSSFCSLLAALFAEKLLAKGGDRK